MSIEKCNHAKNEMVYSLKNRLTITKKVQGGVKGEWGRKWQQFFIILHLLH